jgi:FKBP-type peptidyl-prolyl cis-trans isomerase FkpA
MRKFMFTVLIVLLFIPACSPEPKTEEQKAFYAMGVNINKQLSVFDMSPEELKLVQQGMSDAAAGKKLAVDPDASLAKVGELARARMTRAAEKQKALAKPFLEKAAAEKGAQKTASGLIYIEMKAGTGAQPKASDVVKIHYTGTFVDGKEFESSLKRGQPVEVSLGQVPAFWQEGIGMMKVGGKAKLVCPSEIAYGDRGRPPLIPGGATLIFEVELLDVKAGASSTVVAPPTPTPKPNAKPSS